jgi:ubiquinone/menaquinone biosynthesis C-methylase UbiE
MTHKHQQMIATEFAKQAQDFGQTGLTLSSAELLNWALGNLPHDPDTTALDIATGTAHLARALAPHVGRITGIDATPEMLVQGIDAAKDTGLTNLNFVRGLAEHLPFPSNTFDLTVCRLAIHHYDAPARHVNEMVRVCKPDGAVALVDLTAPTDESLAETYNHYERLRDPSHTVALSLDGLVDLLVGQGINVTHVEQRQVVVKIERWLALTRTPEARANIIRRALHSELDGGPKTGMSPFVQGDELAFRQIWAVVSGER